MCHVHTNEELATILENLADLFAWKRRKSLVEAAAVLQHAESHERTAVTPRPLSGGPTRLNPLLRYPADHPGLSPLPT